MVKHFTGLILHPEYHFPFEILLVVLIIVVIIIVGVSSALAIRKRRRRKIQYFYKLFNFGFRSFLNKKGALIIDLVAKDTVDQDILDSLKVKESKIKMLERIRKRVLGE